jgi:hypothetical protein
MIHSCPSSDSSTRKHSMLYYFSPLYLPFGRLETAPKQILRLVGIVLYHPFPVSLVSYLLSFPFHYPLVSFLPSMILYTIDSLALVVRVGRTVRARAKTSGGYIAVWAGLWANARGMPGCKYMHYILENVSMAARMEGNYSMTLKMGLRGLGRWSA